MEWTAHTSPLFRSPTSKQGSELFAVAAGMKDIDAIVERFMEAEDANFSLFNYVNEVHAEVEKLEEQIADIKVQHHACIVC